MNVEVGQASYDQIDAIKALYDQVVDRDKGTEYDVLWRRDLHPSDAFLEKSCRQGEIYLAEIAGEIAAAGIFNNEFASGHENVEWLVEAPWEEVRCLHLFCTHPDHRGKGSAKALLRDVESLLRQQGVKAVRLDAFAHNAAARNLYEACGYEYRGLGHMEYEDQEVSHLEFAMYERAL